MEMRGWERCLARTLYAAWTKHGPYQLRPENNGADASVRELADKTIRSVGSTLVSGTLLVSRPWCDPSSRLAGWTLRAMGKFHKHSNYMVMGQLYQKKSTARFLSVWPHPAWNGGVPRCAACCQPGWCQLASYLKEVLVRREENWLSNMVDEWS